MNNLCIKAMGLAAFLFSFSFLPAQEAANTSQALAERTFKKIDLFPAISYAPETKLTLGGIGYYYLDLFRGDPATKISNINFLAVYTLNQQVALEGYWDIFTDGNRWRTRGMAFYNKYPDRNYGRGNEPGVAVVEYLENDERDTLNYLPFNSDRIKLAPTVLRNICPNLYVGLQGEMEYLWNSEPMLGHYGFAGADSTAITSLPVDGIRSGLGLDLLYDSRDYVLNPIKGTLVSFGTLHFGKWMGSDSGFHSYRLDARQFINTIRNHTLALHTDYALALDPDSDGPGKRQSGLYFFLAEAF